MTKLSRRISRRTKRLASGAKAKRLFQLFALSLIVVLSSLAGRHVFVQYLTTIPQGVVFWGDDLSGFSRAAAEEYVGARIGEWMKEDLEVAVERSEQSQDVLSFSVSSLGFAYDVPATVQAMLQTSQYSADILGAERGVQATPVVEISQNVLEDLIGEVVSYEESPQDAAIVLDEATGEWTLYPHSLGYGLSDQQLAGLERELEERALEGDDSLMGIQLEQLQPKVFEEDLQPLFREVQRLLHKEVRWNYDAEEFVFSLMDMPWIIEVDQEEGLVYLSEEALEALIEDFAVGFDQEPSHAEVAAPVEKEVDDKGVFLQSEWIGDFQHGRTLDRDALRQQILEAMDSSSQDVQIDLPYDRVGPAVTTWEGQSLSMLSQGRSSYALAHSDDRLYNVEFGLNKYDGIVIPQGAEFSYNQILGWVTYDAGWKPALAIFGGGGVKPVPGGGLCQVSTTVYRAAVHLGLPVTSRRPHSLDVSYYHAYGYGIDSTIYPPAEIDLRFINDTPGPIVVRTYLDKHEEEVFVEFYGVDDGREIALEQVENREVNLPKQVLYTDEITQGYQEVLQRGRTGRYIEWKQTITRDDGSVEERAIETLYPAQARKVRIGTGS